MDDIEYEDEEVVEEDENVGNVVVAVLLLCAIVDVATSVRGVGDTLGARDGGAVVAITSLVGASVGGCDVGAADRRCVGAALGAALGAKLGEAVGVALGERDGAALGKSVGCAVGALLGANVGALLG